MITTDQDYLISNKSYDLLKRVVTIILPGLATLYASLSLVWGLPASEAVVATFAALATFGGVLLTFSTKSWDNSEDRFDGALITTGYDPDTGLPNLELNITNNPNDLIEKGTVVLRSVDET